MTRQTERRAGGATLLLAALLVLSLLPAPVPAASGGDGDALLARVAGKYASVGSLSARFRQEVPLKSVGIVRKASGKLWFSRPSRMRWDYEGANEQQLFLADGKALYFRPPGSPQVFRRRLDEKGLGGKIPMLLLFGEGDITALFRVESASPAAKAGTTALRLVPRGEGAPEVTRVDLVVGEDLSVREIHIHDRLGGANHIYLDGVVLNPPLPADHFTFRKPAGTEVVDG